MTSTDYRVTLKKGHYVVLPANPTTPRTQRFTEAAAHAWAADANRSLDEARRAVA